MSFLLMTARHVFSPSEGTSSQYLERQMLQKKTAMIKRNLKNDTASHFTHATSCEPLLNTTRHRFWTIP